MLVKQFCKITIVLDILIIQPTIKNRRVPQGQAPASWPRRAYLATQLSFSVTMRLNTGLPGVESTRSATK